MRGAYEFVPRRFPDDRGHFVSPFQEAALIQALGHSLNLAQTNHSVSRRGTVRGVHFAEAPPGQAKYVYCPHGALLDVVVDLRIGSPTFGQWDAVRLDSVEFRAVYLPEGLGHAFVALEDYSAAAYICSTAYNAPRDHAINPLDPELGLPWPVDLVPILSERDTSAPTLAQALASGILPRYADCLLHYEKLRTLVK